ncbi:MAG TPA: hypothetical protein VJR89_12110 [Polyangiales bacterium]|nr:hypothetical protein [Polyangiales bacterium]
MPRADACVVLCVLAALSCKEPPPGSAVCASSTDCADGESCAAAPDPNAADLEPLSLACSSKQQGRAAGVGCERGGQCASGICLLAGACASPCSRDSDCEALQRCQDGYARGEGGRLHPLSACVAMVDLPRGTQTSVEVQHAAWSGGIDRLALPPTAARTLFLIEHLDDDTWPVPSSASSCRPPLCAVSLAPRTEPDISWFDREQLLDPDGPKNPIALGDHVYPLSVLVPNGPHAAPDARGYVLAAESKRAGRARITQLSRIPESGRLDLNLYYAGVFEDAGDDIPEVLQAALEEVDRIFEPADVFIGELRQIHVTGELLERGSELPDAEVSRGFARLKRQYGVYPQLPELFELSAGAGNVALDVFFVSSIERQGEAELGGIAGGTPLPFGMHGTGASGIAIAADALQATPLQLGRALAHELGHALGLFHTTERDGTTFDPFDDTPSCELDRDRNGNGLEASECQGAGADNLMFPTLDPAAFELSPQQIAQLRAAMILQ